VKAVNLIPADASKGTRGSTPGFQLGPSHAILVALGVALALVTVYVLTSNKVSSQKAALASLQQQVSQAQAQTSHLTNYQQFVQLAVTRATTVGEIAATRFDWHAALTDLSKVVPADTALQSLLATVAPGVTVNGAGSGATTSALRGDIPAPAFEMKGCTATHDDVARLISRLRLINGVTRVTLSDSVKPDMLQAAPSLGTSGAKSVTSGCWSNGPTFDLVVFFRPLPGALPSTPTSPAGQTTTSAAQTTSSAAPATTSSSSGQPVGSTTTATTTSAGTK
jgi:Tfp pilus assembly protein PilN